MLFLSDLSRQECHRHTTVNQVSTMQLLGWVTDETDVCSRQLTHENSHLQSARTFSRTRTSSSTRSTRYDLRTAHVRGKMRLFKYAERSSQDFTLCFALLRVRGPNTRIDSHGSTCADTNLFLAEFTKRGQCDNQESGTQHQ